MHNLARLLEPAPIRVLIVDDSAVVRAALTRMIDDRDGMTAVAALPGAAQAIAWLESGAVDIVLLDINMPGLGGLDALPTLLAAARGGRVIIVSAAAGEGAAATVTALALGAADTLAKPAVGGLGAHFAEELTARILRIGRADPAGATSRPVLRPAATDPVACLAIGASTGGIHALAALLGDLPPSFDAPILITQHLPAVFMPFFADQVAALSGRPAKLARQGDRLARGSILIAPGDRHLGVARYGAHVAATLLDHNGASRCRPSVDPMFATMAEIWGSGAVGVVLTGMGRDGAIGAQALADAGGTLLAQDQASATVWGMPGAVARAGLASMTAPPAALARYLARRGSA